VKGWKVCRFHGARSGAPSGEANGRYRTGLHTKEAIQSRRAVAALIKEVLRGIDEVGTLARPRGRRRQIEAFEAKFGRRPGPKDPVFFDPNSDAPTPMPEGFLQKEILEAMHKAGTPAQIVYAYRKTGLLLRDDLMSTYPPESVAEWEAAIDEYFVMEGEARHSASGTAEAGPAGHSWLAL
jgi:hypothetical protein